MRTKGMSSQKYQFLMTVSKKASQNITREVERPGKSWGEWMALIRRVALYPSDITEYQKSVERWRHKAMKIDFDGDKIIKTSSPSPFDEERLKSRVIAFMNQTLSSGKITRISALDINLNETPSRYSWYKWPEVMKDIFKGQDKTPSHGAIIGLEGSGKSYFAVWLTEVLKGWNVYSNIRMWRNNHGASKMDYYSHVQSLKELFDKVHERSIFILDESGIHWSQADYATKRNRTMGKLLRVCRKKKVMFILVDQLYRTLPRDILERNPIIFDLKKRSVSIQSEVMTSTIERVTKQYLEYDPDELPSFDFNFDLDKYLEAN